VCPGETPRIGNLLNKDKAPTRAMMRAYFKQDGDLDGRCGSVAKQRSSWDMETDRTGRVRIQQDLTVPGHNPR
jgi:hypothetical protein